MFSALVVTWRELPERDWGVRQRYLAVGGWREEEEGEERDGVGCGGVGDTVRRLVWVVVDD